MLQGNKLLTSFFKKSQERPSLSRPTPYNFHQATDRKRKAGSEVLSLVEKQQVSQDGMIHKIRLLVDHVFFIIITIIIIFLFAIMTLKYKKRKKYRKHTKRERGQKEKKLNEKTRRFNQRT